MRGQDVLHLSAVDVLPAGDDHVLLPVDNEDVALGVAAHQIAGVKPATGEGLRGGQRIVPVTRHQGGPPVHDLADLTDGYVTHVVVDDPRRHGRNDLAHRAEFPNCVLAQQHAGHRRHLGLSESGQNLGTAEGLRHLTQQGVRCRCRTPGHRAQTQFARPRLLFGAHHLPLRGHQKNSGDLLGGQHVEQVAGVECAQGVDDGGGTHGHRREHPADAGDVEQRHTDEPDIVVDIRTR